MKTLAVILEIFFGKVEPKKFIRLPEKGERWNINTDQPWLTDGEGVRIIDVKEGWVRYYDGIMRPDCRMRVDRFAKMYSPTFYADGEKICNAKEK